jgi:quinoprotein dehydrogenase-associated probable ABC transporter substrate-binding protein
MRPRTEILAALAALVFSASAAQADTLRFCTDANNLPFSNRAGQGFENEIANLVARDLHKSVAFVWVKEREDFIKKTLNAGKCDVVMGMPAAMDEAETTQPYYASTYVFVSRKSDNLNLTTLSDTRLRTLKIGVHLIGDEDAPPEAALGREGIVNNVVGFMIYDDYSRPNPPARPIEAVERKGVDVAAVWGPLGGYFAKISPVPLTVTPIADTGRFAPLQFRYAIAMGVRKGNDRLRDALNASIARNRAQIRNILVKFGVPLVEIKGGANG